MLLLRAVRRPKTKKAEQYDSDDSATYRDMPVPDKVALYKQTLVKVPYPVSASSGELDLFICGLMVRDTEL